MLWREDGTLLLATAGTGDPREPNTGALLELRDENGDGDFDDPGERRALLRAQPSANILHLVGRDEVFGMAALARHGDTVLASLAFFDKPSTVFRVDRNSVTTWGTFDGNLNAMVFDTRRRRWLSVSSSGDSLLALNEGGEARTVVQFPELGEHQDPVPGYLRFDNDGHLLVSFFSGVSGEEHPDKGIAMYQSAGGIVRVNLEDGRWHWVVPNLTAPTDFVVDPDGDLYVLELCDGFVDAISTRDRLHTTTSHGGFRRHSGRLLHVRASDGSVRVLADGLDTPTNLLRTGDTLWIAQGMGTPGRSIPTPDGPAPLQGFIETLQLR